MSADRGAARAGPRAIAGVVLFAIAALAPPAAGQARELAVELEGVSVLARSSWPTHARKGFFPILVEIRNDSEDSRRVELRAAAQMDPRDTRSVEFSARLEPGERREVEMIAPISRQWSNQYSLRARVGSSTRFMGAVGAPMWPHLDVATILVVSDRAPDAGELERWEDAVAADVLQIDYRYRHRGRTAQAEGTPKPNDTIVAHATLDELPHTAAAYSSLDLVVIDTGGELPRPRELGPILAWARTGGSLAFFGPNARSAVETIPEVAAWLEPRFEFKTWEDGGATAWSSGLGAVFVADHGGSAGAPPRGPFATAAQVEAVRWAVDAGLGFVPDGHGWRMQDFRLAIPGVEDVPHRAMAGLLLLFAILIGPVNFWLVKRSGRPVLLLVSIPAIAFTTAVVLVAIGVLHQGLDVKSAARTFALLDQRTHRVSSAELRSLFCGLQPAAGLRPTAGTSCFAEVPPRDSRRTVGNLRVDHSEGLLLAGDYLPARRVVEQTLLVDRAARPRLAVRPAGSALEVDNALGVGIEALVLRDEDGDWWRAPSAIADGGTATLEPLEPAVGDGLAHELWQDARPPELPVLPEGAYVAAIDAAFARDDCGVAGRELFGTHRLLGILGDEIAGGGR